MASRSRTQPSSSSACSAAQALVTSSQKVVIRVSHTLSHSSLAEG
jgi:hypothetical protein